jgi:hypothetical protein
MHSSIREMVVMISRSGLIFLTLALSFGGCAMANSVEPIEIRIDNNNASEHGIEVVIQSEGFPCQKAEEVFIKFPNVIRERQEFHSVSISITTNEEILLDAPLALIEARQVAHIKNFHGTTFCIEKGKLQDAKIRIAYGIGQHDLTVFMVDSLPQYL